MHIFKELNEEADKISKLGLVLDQGFFLLQEHSNKIFAKSRQDLWLA